MIELKNVNKFFKKTQVLHDISLKIQEGECVIISGVSGSGKSTLLSIIASFLKPSSGNVLIENQSIEHLNDFYLSQLRVNTIGFVPQAFHLFEKLSVRENILLALILQKHQDIEQHINTLMERINILHKADAEVSTLSGGEKQRCIIARALVNDPKVLLFDEPTANLDEGNSLIFKDIIDNLKSRGKTIIIATHDPFLMKLDFVDTIIKMKDGYLE